MQNAVRGSIQESNTIEKDSIDYANAIDQKFQNLLNLHKFFVETIKEINTKVCPVAVTAKDLSFGCQFLYETKKDSEGVKLFFCANPENIEEFLRTGASILTCKGCEQFNS